VLSPELLAPSQSAFAVDQALTNENAAIPTALLCARPMLVTANPATNHSDDFFDPPRLRPSLIVGIVISSGGW